MLISDEYRKQLQELHSKTSFGSGSRKHRERVKSFKLPDILDYGCGKATLEMGRKYDPAIPEYAADPDPADLVVCTDVLEHIEPDCLDDVLKHIHSKMRVKGFFIIALCHASKNLPDGRNAHLIVESEGWWRGRIAKYFNIEHSATRDIYLDLVVTPKVPDWCSDEA